MYYFASTAYGEEPRLFHSAAEVYEELLRLKATVADTEARLLALTTARETVEALPTVEGEEEKRAAVVRDLWEAEESVRRLLEQKRERLTALTEEWTYAERVR
jgi:hypothetical protein